VMRLSNYLVSSGKTQVLDWPLSRLEKRLGGIPIVGVADLGVAIAWAARSPVALFGVAEVRPAGTLPTRDVADYTAGRLWPDGRSSAEMMFREPWTTSRRALCCRPALPCTARISEFHSPDSGSRVRSLKVLELCGSPGE
jgi:hypothetical protein